MSHPYGYQMEPDEYPEARCPVCGNIFDKIYIQDSLIIGCNECVEEADPCDYRDCFGGAYGET